MPKPQQKHFWNKYRWLTAGIGLSLLVLGQVEISNEIFTDRAQTQLGGWLNNEIHLNIPAIEHVLMGLPLLLAGAVLLYVALHGSNLLPNEPSPEKEKPVLLRFLLSNISSLLVGIIVFVFLLWQIQNRDYRISMVIQWLVILIFFAIMAAWWDTRRQVNISPGIGRQDLLWMVGLTILGLVVGSFRLQGLPDMLIGDEGAFFATARDIALGDFKPPIFSSGVYTFPVLSSIGQGLLMKIFGVDLWGWRFSSVIAGVLAIIPLYLLGRDAFNRKIAVASSIALVFSPYFLAFSRLGYNNIQALFITALTLYWLFLGFQRSSFFYLFIAGCAAGLGFYTYFAARMALVIALLFIAFSWLGKKWKLSWSVLALGIFTLGAFLVVGPYISYGIRYDTQGISFKVFESVFFNTFNGLQFYSQEKLTAITPIFEWGGNELFYNPKIYLVLIARGFFRTLLIFQKPWLISEHFIAYPLAGTVGVFFYLIGMGAMIKRIKEPRFYLLMIWYLVTIFGLSVLNTVPPRHTHMVSIIPLLALLMGIGICAVARAITAFASKSHKFSPIILSVLTGMLVLGGIYDYFILMPAEYHPNPDQIISWTGIYAQDEKIVFVYTDQQEVNRVHPYLLTEYYPDITYQTISVEEFQLAPQEYLTNEKTVIFYYPDLADRIAPLLRAEWGEQTILRDFQNPDGIPVLSAGMNTPFIFERDRSLSAVFLESYGRLSLLVLLLILSLLFVSVIFFPASLTLHMPRPVRRFISWFNSQDKHPEQEEIIESNLVIPVSLSDHQEIPPEPPGWASEILPPSPAQKADKFVARARSIPTEQGRDYYLHIHFPTIRIPWIRIPAGISIQLPDLTIPMPVGLSGIVILAVAAQILISTGHPVVGIICYALSAAGLIYWAYKNPKWLLVLTNQVRMSLRAEILIGVLLLIAVIFIRTYDLGYRVYGLEADETKWTVQSWLSAILQVDLGEFASAHFIYIPVDFWFRSIFLRIFGLNFISARIETAFISTVGIVFLYLLIRKLTKNPPLAFLSTVLFGFSFLELNTSHQALHDTPLGIWIMGGLYFLVSGIIDRKSWQFQLSGILIALGILSYDTFFPTAIFSATIMLGVALYKIIKMHASPKEWLKYTALFLWPILLVYFVFIREYLAERNWYYFGIWRDSVTNKLEIGVFLRYLGKNISDLFITLFSGTTWQDSLLRWEGTMVNPVLLPFMAIGIIYNLCNLRKPFHIFLSLWFLSQVIPALIMGTVWPRVIFTSVPVLIIWGAMGLWILLAAIRPWISTFASWAIIPLFTIFLVVIIANDYRIFTTGIQDPVDRVKRRELADLAYASAKNSDLVLFPYIPAQDDSLELESHVLLFSVAGGRALGLDAENYYEQIPFDQLLLYMWENRARTSIDVFYDKTSLSMQEDRILIMNTLMNCYPGGELSNGGEFFDVYHFDTETLNHPLCYQAGAPTPISPLEGVELVSGEPIMLEWDTGDFEPSGYSITIERNNPNVFWIEAEDVFQTEGWYSASDFAIGFSGYGFLLDNWESGEARYQLNLEEQGEYRVWIRSYKRRYNDQQNFVTINGQVHYFSGNAVPLDQWVWESLGTFELPAGEVTLGMGRIYGQDEMFSVFVDTILVTAELQDKPEESSVWKNVFIFDDEHSDLSKHMLHETLQPGKYRWSVRVFDGDRLVDSEGVRGIAMPYINFTVIP